MARLAVFTDLDGTLLDHRDYSWTAASDALHALRRRNIPLILASSKTAAEIAVLHQQLELSSSPAIIENGAGIFRPGSAPDSSDTEQRDYSRILHALSTLPATLTRHFTGFSQLSHEQIADLTGLSVDQASLAATRRFSEPGVWDGSESDREQFLGHLQALGISARRGGRFLTLSFGATKADRMHEIRQELALDTVIALGDAPNDAEMLESADIGVIIRNDHGAVMPPLAGEAQGYIRRTVDPGPTGWNTAILEILADLDQS